MRDNKRSAKQRRDGTLHSIDALTFCLLRLQCIEWRFDYAWKLGLRRHYLG
ncbi:rpoE leader peptide RseD [Superficieibacter sp.]|uniref:rpoE leader peptide RseD n=1 Tax=Superficieibacter sp. TaxID=2303322 RepID=UPI0028AF2854|nr:rpoE leader peptide RseD [Superficieibacter sp.]